MRIRIDNSLLNKLGTIWVLINIWALPLEYFIEAFSPTIRGVVTNSIAAVALLYGMLLIICSLLLHYNQQQIGLIIVLIIVVGTNILVFKENNSAVIPIFKMLLMTYMASFALSSINSFQGLYNTILKTSYVAIPLCIAIRVLVLPQVYREYGNFSIMLFPYAFIVCAEMFKKKGMINTIFGLISAFSLLVFGNRTSILLLAIGMLLLEYKKNPVWKTLAFIIIGIGLITFSSFTETFFNNILDSLIRIFYNKGIYSRAIVFVKNEGIFNLSGRELFYQNALALIKKSPLLGNGVGSDMVYNFYNIYSTSSSVTGFYSHNGFLEMAVEFGVPLAIIVWMSIFIMALRKYVNYDRYDIEFVFFIIMLVYGIGRTFLGYPYWYNWYFWGAIGMLMKNNPARLE